MSAYSLGISFIDKIAIQFKVIALVFSCALMILNGAMSFLNYKNMYEQRTKTLVRLLSLRREYAGTMVQIDKKYLLSPWYINEVAVESFAKCLMDAIAMANKWLDETEGEFILDPDYYGIV